MDYYGPKYHYFSIVVRSLAVSADARFILNRFEINNVQVMAFGIYRTLTTADMIPEWCSKVIQVPVHFVSKCEEVSMGLLLLLNKKNLQGNFIILQNKGLIPREK
jgi:hypothetical protein